MAGTIRNSRRSYDIYFNLPFLRNLPLQLTPLMDYPPSPPSLRHNLRHPAPNIHILPHHLRPTERSPINSLRSMATLTNLETEIPRPSRFPYLCPRRTRAVPFAGAAGGVVLFRWAQVSGGVERGKGCYCCG